MKVQVGDHIIQLNGDREPAKMLAAIQAETLLALEIVRPFRFQVKAERPKGEPLGIGLSYPQNSCAIKVKNVQDGCIDVYNRTVAPSADYRIEEGDYIADVNGIDLVATKMAE